MTRSAPSRDAASTAHRPTAPSPITAIVRPGAAPAEWAAWWPVPITSDSESRAGIRGSSGATGAVTRVPSASGTRANSPWPPSTGCPSRSVPAHPADRTHEVGQPDRQGPHTPQEHTNGAMTRSPARTVATWSPTSSTTPTSSCPIRPRLLVAPR
nr:hypothetical protein [Nakamurella multipartita]